MSHPDPFQDLVDALCRTLTSTSTPAPSATTSAFTAASPSPSAIASPMAKTAPFTGLAEDCSGFILQCSLILEMQPHLYPDDSTKVAFIISQLEGRALRWAEALWTQKNQVVKSLSSFISHFKEVFGKPAWDSCIAGNFISGALCRQLQLNFCYAESLPDPLGNWKTTPSSSSLCWTSSPPNRYPPHGRDSSAGSGGING
ncbi:Retrotransposon-like protein 1 [Anabarilius grahami]|uniref:Retrotransposon-like protein 1 n=1 Tax=Anabarilius grahami TaxID=495550 RepID=A0A3N0Y831_ANAGA|nr:Retrotransposon-like protein 1 [Anabarilius grahami]